MGRTTPDATEYNDATDLRADLEAVADERGEITGDRPTLTVTYTTRQGNERTRTGEAWRVSDGSTFDDAVLRFSENAGDADEDPYYIRARNGDMTLVSISDAGSETDLGPVTSVAADGLDTTETRAVADGGRVEPDDDETRAINAYEDVVAVEQHAPGMVRVVTWSDAYVVDARDAGCNCPDKEYNDAPRCKHEVAALASDVGRLPSAGMVVDSLTERVATDGGEQTSLGDTDDRPDDCECWSRDGGLPCATCFLAGFTRQNPDAPAAADGTDDEFHPSDYENVREALREAPPGYGAERVINYFDPVVDDDEVPA